MSFLNKRRRVLTKHDDKLIARLVGKTIATATCIEDANTRKPYIMLRLSDGNRINVARDEIEATHFTYYGSHRPA